VPSALFNGPSNTPTVDGLAALGSPEFDHHYYVNATPTVVDIDLGRTEGGSGTDWRTVLIGGLGKGGRSYYAIDVTKPLEMTSETNVASKVLWEFTHEKMGYTFGEPAVVRTRKHGWVVILPSGYNNSDGQGYLFIVNPRTGALIQMIRTGVGTTAAEAGLAHVNAYIVDRTEGVADAAYAGDLLGNVWRVDLTDMSGTYPDAFLIAKLTDGGSAGTPQPVTTRPLIEIMPGRNSRHVLVGTGRLLDTTDIGNGQGQSFYSIIDGTNVRFFTAADGVPYPIVRNNLVADVDVTNGVDLAAAVHGWYIDFGIDAGSVGWRVLSDPASFFGQVSFAATLPNGNACSPAGTSRVYVVAFNTGKTVLKNSQAFLNFDSVVTDQKFLGLNGKPELVVGTTTGENARPELNPLSGLGMRRLNWRELPLRD
jgi:type IV pilus assembly protein PilY1